jgi:hypothetical protein
MKAIDQDIDSVQVLCSCRISDASIEAIET